MFIDSHCHLDFLDNPQQALSRAKQQNVQVLVVPAVTANQWPELLKLQRLHYKNLMLCYGLHPLYIEQHKESDLQTLIAYIKEYSPIAIGECGLDGNLPAQMDKQIYYFMRQIEIALDYQLPLIIHAAKALEKTLQILKKHPGLTFVIHSFTGSQQQLDQILELGGYIGIGGTSTYPRAARLRKQLAVVAENRYLLETDAPDQPIFGYQGQENTPDKIVIIAENLADLRGQTVSHIGRQSTKNCGDFFKYSFNQE